MSSKPLALEVDRLSKRYMLSHQEKHRYMSDALVAKLKNPFAKPPREEFWALRDISFDVPKGEVLGVIGRNGAGKSTLLKILSQIAEPTEGEIRLHGRIGSLLEVGTGFHPELTGRENIFLNGTILGMRRREVEKHFDEIVEFAEVARFIDTPVKRYSSGMYVRLAFAVAAHLDPEILIIDEVLAVGDAQFQAKCLGKIKDVSNQDGRTVLFVSHNMAAIKTLCTQAALLRSGQLVHYGDVDRAVEMYFESQSTANSIVDRVTVVNPGITLEEITINGSDATELSMSHEDTTLDVVIRGRTSRRLRARLGMMLVDPNGVALGNFGEGLADGMTPQIEEGPFEWRARIELPRNMNEGRYSVIFEIAHHNVQQWLYVENAVVIDFEGTPTSTGETLRYSSYGFVMLEGEVSREPSLAER